MSRIDGSGAMVAATEFAPEAARVTALEARAAGGTLLWGVNSDLGDNYLSAEVDFGTWDRVLVIGTMFGTTLRIWPRGTGFDWASQKMHRGTFTDGGHGWIGPGSVLAPWAFSELGGLDGNYQIRPLHFEWDILKAHDGERVGHLTAEFTDGYYDLLTAWPAGPHKVQFGSTAVTAGVPCRATIEVYGFKGAP